METKKSIRIPVPMVLHCPCCGTQHIDAPNPEIGWTDPPHKSHLCLKCGIVWRPAGIYTRGIKYIIPGSNDTWPTKNSGIAGLRINLEVLKDNHELRNELNNETVRIWTDEWNSWYRKEYCGYTIDIREAGIYKLEDAYNHIGHAGPEKQLIFEIVK